MELGGQPQRSRPRLLRIATRLNVGGPARHVAIAARGLEADFETVVAAGTAAVHEGELLPEGLPVQRVPLGRRVSPVRDVQALRAVRNMIDRGSFAIVHSHMAKAGAVARIAARMTHHRPRTVHTYHGHVLEGYFSRPMAATFARLERRLARRTDALVAVSTEVRDALLDLGIGRSGQYTVIPPGLELEPYLNMPRETDFLREELGLSRGVPLVGIIGRLTGIKDHSTAFSALARMSEVHCAVVGDGELRGDLEREAHRLGLGHRIHFLGWRSDLPQLLSGLDVVVLTSRNEGTPVALIEAAAAGVPAVATAVGGVRTVVLDQRTGYLVPPGAPDQVGQAVSRLLADGLLRRRMGDAAREHSRSNFGAEAMLAALRDLYWDLLGR